MSGDLEMSTLSIDSHPVPTVPSAPASNASGGRGWRGVKQFSTTLPRYTSLQPPPTASANNSAHFTPNAEKAQLLLGGEDNPDVATHAATPLAPS